MNKRFLLALGGALVFGMLAIFTAKSYLNRQVERSRAEQEADVVIALTEVPLGTTISDSQVKVVPYQRDLVPEGALTKKEEVVGRVTVTDLSPKSPVLSRQLAAAGSPAGLVGVLPVGMRAVSVRVDEASSVAGFVLAGSFVDVIVIIQPSYSDAKPVSKVILQNVRVLANGQQMQTRTDGKATLTNTVTLEVTPAQAEKLKLAESEGKLQLSIRNSTDQVAERTGGATRADVLNDEALELRARKGARSDVARPAPAAAAPLPPIQHAVSTAKAPVAAPAPAPRSVIAVELIEGSKRSRVEFVPQNSKKD